MFEKYLFLSVALILTACSSQLDANTSMQPPIQSKQHAESSIDDTDKNNLSEAQSKSTANSDAVTENGSSEEQQAMGLQIIVGSQVYTVTLFDNPTAKAFREMLPLTLNMSELNGNEKFFYFDSTLPSDSERPGQINSGDLMLFGNNCLVLFYDSFDSSYSYTRIGYINDPTGLASALGRESVEVTFSLD